MPAISIGMPVHNGEAYLRETLASILAQTFDNFEVIVSDNASTDATATIVEKFAARDGRIRVIRQPQNIGALANFRFVLEEARAEFFVWRAHDDLTAPNYLEVLYRALRTAPGNTLAVPTVVRRRLDGTEAARTPFPDFSRFSRPFRVIRHLHAAQSGWLYGLFRTEDVRRALARAKAEFPYLWAQDHLIVLPFIVDDRVTGTNETVFYQRETGISAEQYRPKALAEQWRLVHTFLRFSTWTLMESRLQPWEKVVCLPFLLGYTNSKAERFKRILRRTAAWPFRHAWAMFADKTE